MSNTNQAFSEQLLIWLFSSYSFSWFRPDPHTIIATSFSFKRIPISQWYKYLLISLPFHVTKGCVLGHFTYPEPAPSFHLVPSLPNNCDGFTKCPARVFLLLLTQSVTFSYFFQTWVAKGTVSFLSVLFLKSFPPFQNCYSRCYYFSSFLLTFSSFQIYFLIE